MCVCLSGSMTMCVANYLCASHRGSQCVLLPSLSSLSVHCPWPPHALPVAHNIEDRWLLSSTDSGRAGAGGPCPPHESVCVSACVCVCARLYTAWGTAWDQQPSLSSADAAGQLEDCAPHIVPRLVQTSPCPRRGLGLSPGGGVRALEVQVWVHMASSWSGRARVAQCPG
jgi:hypothetical protein